MNIKKKKYYIKDKIIIGKIKNIEGYNENGYEDK